MTISCLIFRFTLLSVAWTDYNKVMKSKNHDLFHLVITCRRIESSKDKITGNSILQNASSNQNQKSSKLQ